MSERPRFTIALDPGGTTGYCVAQEIDGVIDFQGGQDTPAFVMRWLHTTLHNVAGNVHVAAERYTIHPGVRSPEYDALYVIGATLHMCDWYGAPFVLQDVSAAKHMGSTKRLKALGWWLPGKEHANDAARHLLLSLVSRGWYSHELEG